MKLKIFVFGALAATLLNFIQETHADSKGCVVTTSLESAAKVYDIYEAYRAKKMDGHFSSLPHARGIFEVDARFDQKKYSPRGYRLRYVFSGRDVEQDLIHPDSDLFMAFYEPVNSAKQAVIAFKGSSLNNHDWLNNFINRGAEQVDAFFDILADNKADTVTEGYRNFFINWFSAHSSLPMMITGHSLGGALAQTGARFFTIMAKRRNLPSPRFNLIVYNSLGSTALVGRLKFWLKNEFFKINNFENISTLNFDTQNDPLQLANIIMGMWDFSKATTLASLRGLKRNGTFVMPSREEPHIVSSVMEDLKFSLNPNAAREFDSFRDQDPRSSRQLRTLQFRYQRQVDLTDHKGGAAKVDTPESIFYGSIVDSRDFIEKQASLLNSIRPIIGTTCTEN